MKKLGRNEPCPCGSGKKYKKCCLYKPKQPSTGGTYVYTDLDNLSNQVPVLIKQEKYDEAEAVCQRLMEQYPEQIDGLHRYAALFEAKGENQKAAEYYKKTVEFAREAEGFEEKSVEFFLKKAEQLAAESKE